MIPISLTGTVIRLMVEARILRDDLMFHFSHVRISSP